jgi:hypothetical protein
MAEGPGNLRGPAEDKEVLTKKDSLRLKSRARLPIRSVNYAPGQWQIPISPLQSRKYRMR